MACYFQAAALADGKYGSSGNIECNSIQQGTSIFSLQSKERANKQTNSYRVLSGWEPVFAVRRPLSADVPKSEAIGNHGQYNDRHNGFMNGWCRLMYILSPRVGVTEHHEQKWWGANLAKKMMMITKSWEQDCLWTVWNPQKHSKCTKHTRCLSKQCVIFQWLICLD